jgi:hypothetical protein
VIVIQGERIADVGPEGSFKIPPGAEEIDLSAATVLPGLIEGHNHMFKIGDHAGADSGASVPAEIKPGSVFSWPQRTQSSILSRVLPRRVICRVVGHSIEPAAAASGPGCVRTRALARQALKGLVDAAAGGGLEHEILLPDSRCLNVA